MKAYLLIIWAVFNIISGGLYFSDKIRAVKRKDRIPESSLLAVSLLGGVGAFFGMTAFRHKTKHIKFIITVPVFAVLSIAEIMWILAKA